MTAEFKTESDIEILTLYFRPAQGPLPEGPTTMSTNGIYIIDPQPELLEQIAKLYVEAAAMLRRLKQPKCEHLLTEFGFCVGCNENLSPVAQKCETCGSVFSEYHDCEPLL